MRFTLSLFLILFSLAAQAQIEFGLAVGARSGQAETDIVGATMQTQEGWQFGAIAYLPIQNPFGMRSGFLYSQRFAAIERTRAGDVDIDFAYFDVPIQARLQMGDYAGLYGGPVLAFNQSKEVSCTIKANCVAIDVKSFVIPWQVGVDFRIFSQFGAELYYEYIPGDLSTNVSNMKTVGANALFFFE